MRKDPEIPFGGGLAPFALLLAVLFLAACHDDVVGPRDTVDDSEEVPIDTSTSLFARYVALGDNNTAGWRGGGINRESQLESYPVLIAQAMGVQFNVPLIDLPGCPPPFTDAYTHERLDDNVSCSGMAQPVATPFHHLAIPGTHIADALRAAGTGPEMLGGQRIFEAVKEARPTFVSIWFGGDDVYDWWAYRTSPNGHLPWSSEFMPKLESLVELLQAMGVKGGILISLPSWPGRYFTDARVIARAYGQGLLPPALDVAAPCSTYSQRSAIPFDYYRDLMNRALDGESVTLGCSSLSVVRTEEVIMFHGDENWWYDEYVRELAERVGWAFIEGWRLVPSSSGYLPALPGSPDPTFGPSFGTDGIYLSRAGQAAAAAKILGAINEHYGTDLTLAE